MLSHGAPGRLVDRLAAEGGDAALIAEILRGAGADTGEVALASRRVLCWRRVGLRGGGSLWAFHDITGAHQVASALRDAGHLLRMLEAHAEGVVLELDEEARIVGLWAATAALLGVADGMLQGRTLAEATGEPRGSTLDALVRRVSATGEPERLEYVRTLRGERRVFAANALLMPGYEGEAPRVTAMIRDVTERARTQTQLLEAERLVSVGLLAAGVAHEINNPLAYSLLNLERIQARLRELAARDPNDAHGDLLEAVRMSLEGCRRVETIVRDLRRFSRADHEEVRVPLDVRRVVEFAIDMAAPEAKPRARIVRELGEVPLVIASEGRLSQVFLNLIVNAAQAIPEGRPDDNEIRVVTRTDDRGRAVVEVRDTGEGISASVMRHMFEPFFTTKAPGEGTGLGLAICHRIAASLGGRLTAESEIGRGSVFRLTLPAADEA
ncbi:MAG TPA: ATP-binding protein [Polyangiaceae bacterium]|nr:ATP-binding protein [Polyangiaceae bacterium]